LPLALFVAVAAVSSWPRSLPLFVAAISPIRWSCHSWMPPPFVVIVPGLQHAFDSVGTELTGE
jgi:hypothetical protein